MTEAHVQAEVLSAVFADRDRSLEGAIERAARAGVELERERVRSILELKVPPARGIEQTIMIMALSGASLEQVKGIVDFLSSCVDPEALARSRRAEFRVIENLKQVEGARVG